MTKLIIQYIFEIVFFKNIKCKKLFGAFTFAYQKFFARLDFAVDGWPESSHDFFLSKLSKFIFHCQ